MEARLVAGDSGEFTVWVDDRLVAKKGLFLFPSPAKIVDRVRAVLRG